MLGRHHALTDGHAAHSVGVAVGLVGVQVVGDGVACVEEMHSLLVQPPAGVEVFVVVGEVGIEATRIEEEGPVQRDVAGVEATPSGIVTGDGAQVELHAGVVDPRA